MGVVYRRPKGGKNFGLGWITASVPNIKGAPTSTWRTFMMDMAQMSTGTMWGMGLICLIVIAFLVLGIAACIKYLRS
jgi:hypothetical protein